MIMCDQVSDHIDQLEAEIARLRLLCANQRKLLESIFDAYGKCAFGGAERAEMSEFDAMGRELGRGLGGGRGHKCTVFHRDQDFCNGLPRRKGR